MKVTFNETTYEFIHHNDGSTTPSTKELHLYKNGELVFKQHMYVDMFELNLLTFNKCVEIIQSYEKILTK